MIDDCPPWVSGGLKLDAVRGYKLNHEAHASAQSYPASAMARGSHAERRSKAAKRGRSALLVLNVPSLP